METICICCPIGCNLKVEEKNGNRMINGDMIRDIKLMPEKYQK